MATPAPTKNADSFPASPLSAPSPEIPALVATSTSTRVRPSLARTTAPPTGLAYADLPLPRPPLSTNPANTYLHLPSRSPYRAKSIQPVHASLGPYVF